jgi:MFS family permease
MVGLIVAIYEIGCFCGAITTAALGEQLGRRKSIGGGVIVMIVGALLQATSYSRAQVRHPLIIFFGAYANDDTDDCGSNCIWSRHGCNQLYSTRSAGRVLTQSDERNM